MTDLKTLLGEKRTLYVGIAISSLFVALVVATMVAFDWHDEIIRWLEWIHAQGILAPLLFILLMSAVVVMLLPGFFFTTGAGFVFGVVHGTLYVVLGTTLGATIAYLIARRFFGERMAQWLERQVKIKLMAEEIGQHGWQVVLLTRLVPFFPAKLANYFFGLTPVNLREFVVGTLIGIIPFSLHNVWLGAMAALGIRGVNNPIQWGLYGLGFIATVLLILYLQQLAQRALKRYQSQRGQS